MNKVNASFACLEDLFDRNMWKNFLGDIETRLGTGLSHLDTNDPVRRKVDSLDEAADYACAIGPKEESRWLFGKFGKTRISIMAHLHRDPSAWENSVSLSFPARLLDKEEGLDTIVDIFKIGCHALSPFYAYADFIEQIATKCRLDGAAVSTRRELVGIFWLTFLCEKYVKFFGDEKIKMLPVGSTTDKGVIIRLAHSPSSPQFEMTGLEAEKLLGADAFVDPNSSRQKPVGKYVLSYEHLLCYRD